MRLSKKGLQSTDFILTIPRIIFTVVAVLTVVFLVRMFIVQEIEISQTQAKLFVNRLVYSPNAISFVDPMTSRSYPGIIDYAAIDDVGYFKDRVDNAINMDDNRLLAAKITVRFEKDGAIQTRSILFNDVWYRRWEPIAMMRGIDGPGGVDKYEFSRYMLVKEGAMNYPATLDVEVLLSR